MIVDTLDRICTYKELSKNIFKGLNIIKNTSPDIEYGVYQIDKKVKVMVTKYDTKEINEFGFEAHIDNIDIQYPIIGNERVYWAPLQNVTKRVDYDKEKDIAFYDYEINKASYVNIGDGVFSIFFPWDAHSPQYIVNNVVTLKKITIKIKIL